MPALPQWEMAPQVLRPADEAQRVRCARWEQSFLELIAAQPNSAAFHLPRIPPLLPLLARNPVYQ